MAAASPIRRRVVTPNSKRALVRQSLESGAQLVVDAGSGDAKLEWRRDNYTAEEWRTVCEGLLGIQPGALVTPPTESAPG